MKALSFAVITLTLPLNVLAGQSMYCPQNHGYINVGMTEAQVIASCGQPLSKQESNQPAYRTIPAQQLIYNNVGTSTAFYGTWQLSTGNGGAQLEVDVVDNKVRSIKINGSDSNAFSLCGGNMIPVGSPINMVYNACGNPTLVNHTYIKQYSQQTTKQKVWIYQPGQYQPPVSLTFSNGKLQSINN